MSATGLKDKYHLRRLQNNGRLLGLLQSGKYSDVTVEFENGEKFPVHQFIFKQSLESKPPAFITSTGFKILLEYLYNGNPELNNENICDAIIAATYYGASFAVILMVKFAYRFKSQTFDDLKKFEDFLREFKKQRFVGHDYKYLLFNKMSELHPKLSRSDFEKFNQLDQDLKLEYTSCIGIKPNILQELSWNLSPLEFPDCKIISDSGAEWSCHQALLYTKIGKIPANKEFSDGDLQSIIFHVYKNATLSGRICERLGYQPEKDFKGWYGLDTRGMIFTYSSDFDENGLFYYLGTLDGPEWKNPYDCKKINIETPSGFYNIVNQGCQGNNYAVIVNRGSNPTDTCCSASGSGNYFVIDLLEDNSFQLEKATFANHYISSTYSADINIYGSNDNNVWVLLSKTTGNRNICYSIDVKPNENDFFRYFKFESGKSGIQLLLAGMELYGEYTQ